MILAGIAAIVFGIAFIMRVAGFHAGAVDDIAVMMIGLVLFAAHFARTWHRVR